MAEYKYECLECGNITYGYGKYKHCDQCGCDEWTMERSLVDKLKKIDEFFDNLSIGEFDEILIRAGSKEGCKQIKSIQGCDENRAE